MSEKESARGLRPADAFWQGAVAVRVPFGGPDDPARSLPMGTRVLLRGVVYTARDAAHKRIVEALDKGMDLPFDLTNQVIYYAGPCPPAPGQVIGSLGPTTSTRMDAYAPRLLAEGLGGMIGKGRRNSEVVSAITKYGSVYFVTIGGAGALLSRTVKKADLIAYPDLGPEAVYRLEIEGFPAIVGIDVKGNDIYERGNRG